MKTKVGELFILGFHGTTLPRWLEDFEAQFGLGGVILFDYDCQTRTYENNIESPRQLKNLCASIAGLPSRPLIFVDQEGGKVRRLKEKKGFAPLPSQKVFPTLSETEKERLVRQSFSEMKDLGIHYDLAPVVDLDYNPKNPDIGAVDRSYGASVQEVRGNVSLLNQIAKDVGLGLCLKHYPGLGGANTNSHLGLTDLTGTITQEQLDLFFDLAPTLSGDAVLVSHGIVKDWDQQHPVSMSEKALRELRRRLPETLLISDDLQMQGLQMKLNTEQACIQGARAGIDLLAIGNNLMREQDQLPKIANELERQSSLDAQFLNTISDAIDRIRIRKNQFYS